MTLHERGQSFLNRTLASAAGVSVLYTRGADTAPLTATVGQDQPDAATQPTPGTRVSDRERDYLFAYADLVAAGFNEPSEGDKVTEVLNGASVTFLVGRRGTEPAWRWSDRERTRARVHTRRQ